MKYLILFAFMGAFGNLQAEILEKSVEECILKSDSLDTTLSNNESMYTFEFHPLDGSTNQLIYSIDGIQFTGELNDHSLNIRTTPGKHIFQFYYAENYTEVYTDSLEIRNRFHSVYEIRMTFTLDIRYSVDKPVIYLYPEEETEVELTLNIKGEPKFLYPAYDNGWKFIASPSGELSFGEKTYNYLFWESEQKIILTSEELKTGFNVKRDNVISFLEDKLELAGLNSKEKADFITYWGPRLTANDLNYVRFEFNETCNRYAEIEIVPQPTTVYRIFMTWMPIDNELDVKEQTIESFDRSGFSVLEWGGQESHFKQNFVNQNVEL